MKKSDREKAMEKELIWCATVINKQHSWLLIFGLLFLFSLGANIRLIYVLLHG